jgi:hypothetical protein
MTFPRPFFNRSCEGEYYNKGKTIVGRIQLFRCHGARWPTGYFVTALLLTLIASGCGPSGPKRIQVHGKVTFDGNPPPGDGSVYFAPIRPAEGFPARGGYGVFVRGDGAFVVGSVERDDGLMPGTYRVTITYWERPPREDGTSGKSFIPKDYCPPELEITLDGPNPIEPRYDVPPA